MCWKSPSCPSEERQALCRNPDEFQARSGWHKRILVEYFDTLTRAQLICDELPLSFRLRQWLAIFASIDFDPIAMRVHDWDFRCSKRSRTRLATAQPLPSRLGHWTLRLKRRFGFPTLAPKWRKSSAIWLCPTNQTEPDGYSWLEYISARP